jgi:hypothetical protein
MSSNSSCSFISVDGEGIEDNGILLDTQTVFNNIEMQLYKFRVQDIISSLDVWSFNRELNQEHVDNIFTGLCCQQQPHLIGTFKVVRDEYNDMKVIDGQHRLQALKKFGEIHKDKHISIFVEMYNVTTLNDPVVFDLFKLANTNLNINVEDNLNVFVAELVNKLAEDQVLSKGIIDKNDGRVNRPRISKKELYEVLKKNLKIHHLNQPIDVLVKKIKDMNYHISRMSYLQLFSRREPCQKKINMKCNAERYSFYLNIEGNYSIEKWIDEL